MSVAAVLLALIAQAAPVHSAGPTFDVLATQAETARQAGKPEDAAALYRKALQRKPGWKEGLWYLGGIEYSHDDFAGCRQTFHKLVQLDAKAGPGVTMLGLCDYGARDYSSALEHLRSGQLQGLGENDQIDHVAKYHLAMLFTKSSAFEQALELYYALAKGGVPPARELLEGAGLAALRTPTLQPEMPPALREATFLAGKAFWDVSSGHADKAKQEFELLVSKYPDLANVHYYYGAYLLTNDPDEGLAELLKELARSPQSVPVLITTAVEFLRRGDSAKAIPLAREAVRYEPDSFAAHTVLGRALVESGDLQRGVLELEAARQLSPESPQPRIALASAYAKLGRPDDAARERKEFLRLREATKKPGER